MRVPNAMHEAHPWRIHEIVPDFRLEDVWEPPRVGHGDDFARLVEMIAGFDTAASSSPAVRFLFAARWKLGELFGWDRPTTGVDGRVPSLRNRLPADLRTAPTGPAFASLPFESLYLLEDEFAAEVANSTMHGVLHLGRVPTTGDEFRVQLAVYVKTNGVLGDLYMAAIKPFRYVVVYPTLLREFAERWSQSPVPA